MLYKNLFLTQKKTLMDISLLFTEINTTILPQKIETSLEHKQCIDALLQDIALHLKLISVLSLKTKSKYVQQAIKLKK